MTHPKCKDSRPCFAKKEGRCIALSFGVGSRYSFLADEETPVLLEMYGEGLHNFPRNPYKDGECPFCKEKI